MVKQLYLCLQSRWVDLKDVWVRGVRRDQGKVQVSLSWLPVTADRWVTSTSHQAGVQCHVLVLGRETIRSATKTASSEQFAKGVVHIYVDSCRGLTSAKDPGWVT